MTAIVAIALLSAIGFIALAWLLDSQGKCEIDPADMKLFGMPWIMTGMIGYVFLAVTSPFPFFTKIGAVIAGVATVWLIYKTVRLQVSCTQCTICWIVNVLIHIIAFNRH
jgi:uncharacterized membrane protein